MNLQRVFCNSDLQLSALGLGCWSFGGGEYWDGADEKNHDQQNVNAVVCRAVELGINYFDTAEAYDYSGPYFSPMGLLDPKNHSWPKVSVASAIPQRI